MAKTPNGNREIAPAVAALRRRNGGKDALQVVELARRYTQAAMRKLADLMEGKAGTMKVMNKDGVVLEVDVEVPAAVQAKCAEVLIERAWGKSVQGILLKDESALGLNARQLSVAEKIVALQEARNRQHDTTDLEASEQEEIEVETKNVLALPPPASAEDMI